MSTTFYKLKMLISNKNVNHIIVSVAPITKCIELTENIVEIDIIVI